MKIQNASSINGILQFGYKLQLLNKTNPFRKFGRNFQTSDLAFRLIFSTCPHLDLKEDCSDSKTTFFHPTSKMQSGRKFKKEELKNNYTIVHQRETYFIT